MTDWVSVITAVASAATVGIGAARIFSRAENSDLKTRVALAESRIDDMKKESAKNYDYFYKQTHDLANFLDQLEKRIHLLEFRAQDK